VNLRQKIQLNQQANHLSIGELFVDLNRYEIKRGEQEIQLTPREFDLLVCLLKNKNIVLTREQLLDNVWGFQYVGDTSIVDVYIRYLRQKIDKGFDPAYIQTIRGVGYTIKESLYEITNKNSVVYNSFHVYLNLIR